MHQLKTAEAWGPWWHIDHPNVIWNGLGDWSAECHSLTARRKLQESTPWNFSHTYWENRSAIAWYREVNPAFISTDKIF